jgi:hypothetical protein
MIRKIDGPGAPRVRAGCDGCTREEVVAAEDTSRGGARGAVNRAGVLRKLALRGWAESKGRLCCPACEAKRRAGLVAAKPASSRKDKPKEIAMTKQGTPLRAPSREQRREIVQMLELAYDVAAERYRGTDTDATIAEALGGGVMPGWVAEIRDAMFGPDGSNDEMSALLAEMRDWRLLARDRAKAAEAGVQALTTALAGLAEVQGRVDKMTARLEAIRAAVGPKAKAAKVAA